MYRSFDYTANDRLQSTEASVTATPCTLATWAWPAPDAPASTIMNIMEVCNAVTSVSNARNRFQLQRSATDKLVALTGAAGGSSAATSAASMAVGVWAHCAGVYASATSRIAYLDGVSASNGTSRVPAGITHTNIGIALNDTSTLSIPWQGMFRYAAIWNEALTADEVKALAAGKHPRLIRPANLMDCWALDDKTRSFASNFVSRYPLTAAGTRLVSGPELRATGVTYKRANIYSFPQAAAGTGITSVPLAGPSGRLAGRGGLAA